MLVGWVKKSMGLYGHNIRSMLLVHNIDKIAIKETTDCFEIELKNGDAKMLEKVWKSVFGNDAKYQVEEHSFMFDPIAKKSYQDAKKAWIEDGPPWY